MEKVEIQVLEPALCNLEETGRGLEKEVAAVSWSDCTLCFKCSVHSIAISRGSIKPFGTSSWPPFPSSYFMMIINTSYHHVALFSILQL